MSYTMHTLAGVKYDTTLIKGITAQTFSQQLVELLEGGNGSVDNGFSAVAGADPQLTFTTTAIKTALATLGDIDGKAIAASNFVMWFQAVTNGGTREGATSHIKGTAVQGLIIPQTLTLPHRGKATLQYLCIFVSSDGSTAPIAFTGSQSLDTGEGAADELYTLGACEINGTAVEAVQQAVIDFGITPWTEGGSGDKYRSFAAIGTRQPTITLETSQIGNITSDNWGILGAAQDETEGSESVINAAALTNGGTLAGTNVSFTVNRGRIQLEPISGSSGQRLGTSIKITPIYDGSNDVIAVGGLA
ncbi:hypothetical protein STSP2_03166 [Anaerohalosphaera lusitana]|uniref:Uncharacterized protein n=1 Tax=Anaerohalosphaera lusitana TaxID=1936003 RepID=A0A1U9NR21_9BACT|nr:hypothetical protein [Anaerohalosphaera lusitana]AQT69966.1 hypothetical protein STSP2_03166 [Anaerohalosphaera lusitana]